MSNKTEQILNGLESPFLSNELFADESSAESRAFSSSVLDESPFLQGFAENFLASAALEEQYYVEEFPSEDAQAFPEGDDEEQDQKWRDIEYDSPTTSAPITPDALLAIPAFTPTKRATVGKLLTPAASKAAIAWNAKNHPKTSGVSPASIVGALQSYVDLSAINDAIASYNSQNPNTPVNSGTKPVDAVFVEAIHQFQMKCYKDSNQYDGFAGPPVLDSLGFWPRKGLLSSAQTNEWAKGQVRSRRKGIEAALSTSTDLTKDLTQNGWWRSFVNPCFLGWGFVRPIHVYFARKLRKAELWLLSQSRFAGATPVELATLLEINEKHAGGRSESGSKSIHTLGLGIDVKYMGNPHVGDYRDKPIGAKRFSEVMKRATAKISGLTLADEKFPQYLNKLGTDTSKTTGQIYDELVQRDQDLRKYLARAEARADLAALTKGVFEGRVERDPLKGFLNLDRDLVIALRDHACLVWGAVDLGPGSSGDIMHFDCRLDDLGRAVYCGMGGTFNDKHPCWRRSEPPCPQATGGPRSVRSRAGEVLDSESENDSVAELEEVAEKESAEYPGDTVDEFTEEFEKSEETHEFRDVLYESGEHEEELLEFEAPPLLKNCARSDPPGQTLYVEIKLGKDSRCVKLIEENKKKKCVKSETFVIRPQTGIFIPENYSPQPIVDLILYLHGWKTEIPGSDALICEYWDGQKYPVFALREEINASRRNVILVVPTLALKGEAGDLVRPNGLDKYLEKVLEALITYGPYKDQSPTIGNLILAAHSGGGKYMRLLATSGNRAASKIRECWGFDSLYNSADVQPWRRWAKDAPKSRLLFSYYYKLSPTTNSKSLEMDSRGRVDKLPNVKLIESKVPDHFKLVKFYLRERLDDPATILGSTAANPPQGSEQLFEEVGGHGYFADEHEFEDEEFEDDTEASYEDIDPELAAEVEHADHETEDDAPSFEMIVPQVSLADLRTRIDEYFNLTKAAYVLPGGTPVGARPQFRYAKAGGVETAIGRVSRILGKAFEKAHPKAIYMAAYGRAKPSDIAAITQALIDAGELPAVQAAHPGIDNEQLVRALQREFKMGIDCAGYVQLAFIHAFTGSDNDPPSVRRSLGLHERRGWERLGDLSSTHFTKVGVVDAQTGDLFVMKPRAGSSDRAWHTVIIVDHTVSGTVHTFLVDASWGTDLYGVAAGGVARRKLKYDTSTGEWWDVNPITGIDDHKNTTGPYNGHRIHGMFRAKQKK